jgi:hypothetical protein
VNIGVKLSRLCAARTDRSSLFAFKAPPVPRDQPGFVHLARGRMSPGLVADIHPIAHHAQAAMGARRINSLPKRGTRPTHLAIVRVD